MRTLFHQYVETACWNTAQSEHVYSRPRWKKTRPSAGVLILACLGLSACGGGGGGSGGTGTTQAVAPATATPAGSATPAPAPASTESAQTPTAAPVPASTTPATVTLALAAYAGTWYGPCQGRSMDTATLAPASGGVQALQMNLVRNFHAADGCAGSPIAAETLSADFTLSYAGTKTAAALLASGTTAVQLPLDLVTISIPAYTRSRSGSAVTTTTTSASGTPTWCIGYSDGAVCTTDAGPQPAASAPGALYLDKGELVLLSPAGGGYVADGRYTKERVTTTQAQGPEFQRIDTVQGNGALATSGRTLTVHYTGWLYDASKADFKGAQFDTSIGKTPFTFRIGASQVIPGWDQGLLGMRAGGKRTLIIPASLGYGRNGSGTTIPPNAPLLFEVELISVQ